MSLELVFISYLNYLMIYHSTQDDFLKKRVNFSKLSHVLCLKLSKLNLIFLPMIKLRHWGFQKKNTSLS